MTLRWHYITNIFVVSSGFSKSHKPFCEPNPSIRISSDINRKHKPLRRRASRNEKDRANTFKSYQDRNPHARNQTFQWSAGLRACPASFPFLGRAIPRSPKITTDWFCFFPSWKPCKSAPITPNRCRITWFSWNQQNHAKSLQVGSAFRQISTDHPKALQNGFAFLKTRKVTQDRYRFVLGLSCKSSLQHGSGFFLENQHGQLRSLQFGFVPSNDVLKKVGLC